MKTPRPVNQKSIYHSYGDLYEKLMNDEIPIEKAALASGVLAGMNKTYALEIKRAQVEFALRDSNSQPTEIRILEVEKAFDNLVNNHESMGY